MPEIKTSKELTKMKNPSLKTQSSNTKVALSALISAVAAIAVAFIGIVPQLRQGDTSRIADLEKELNSLKQAIAVMPARLGGTSVASRGETVDYKAPHIRLRSGRIDTAAVWNEYLRKGREAMDRSGFTGMGTNEGVVYGFDREYTGLTWKISSGIVLFVVAGPDWKTADTKVENLKRGF